MTGIRTPIPRCHSDLYAVNDVPVVTSASLTLSEGQTVTLAPANVGITDPDNGSFTYTVSGISGGYSS